MLSRTKYVESYWENVASFESLVCKSQVGQYKPVNDIVIHVQESHHSDRILPVFSPVQDTYFVKKVPIFLQKWAQMRNWAHWLTNLIHLSTNGWQYWTVGFPASFWFISCLILFDILFSKKTYLFKIQAVITCPITVAYIPNFSLQKEDAVIVDCNGGRWPVHSDLLRLRFPLFRHIEEIRSVVMSDASPGEVELLLGLTSPHLTVQILNY